MTDARQRIMKLGLARVQTCFAYSGAAAKYRPRPSTS